MVGDIYLLLVVITFTILILNLVIAILSNTYNLSAKYSNGLYLSKILSTRDELLNDDKYGAFLISIIPFNALTIPFIPLALKKPSE